MLLMKNLFLVILYFISLNFVTQAQAIVKLDKSKISVVSLDNKIKSLMQAANVQGLAISIFNNNEPVYEKTFAISA